MTLVVIAEATIFEDVEGEHVSEENRMKDKATSTIANCTYRSDPPPLAKT